jgi:hypothetical protein
MRQILLTGVISAAEMEKLRHAVANAGIDAEITRLETPCAWKCAPRIAPRIVPKISRRPTPVRRPGTGKRNID